jgi:lantibiotic modifying enzyme
MQNSFTTHRHASWNYGKACIREEQRPILISCLRDIEALNLDTMRDPSVSGGLAGAALFNGYLQRTGLATAGQDRAEALLSRAIEELGPGANPEYYSGYSGVAWAIQHIQDWALPENGDDGDSNADVDEALAEILNVSPWKADYDLISGLAGYGVYALERMPRPGARALLERILTRLEETAVPQQTGCAWPTGVHLLPPWQAQIAPNGYYNLGLAHGIPAVLALLAAMLAWGVEPTRTGRLLDQGLAWVRSQASTEASPSAFPSWVLIDHPQPEPIRNRIAWCYGDLGAGLALLQTARILADAPLQALAMTMLRACTERLPEECGCMDACVCHGWAGNALLFLRAYQYTNDELFARAARTHLEHTLSLRKPGEGSAGWLTYFPNPNLPQGTDPNPYIPVAGLLEGSLGIGLVLCAFLDDLEPAWDRMLMTSLHLPPSH